ncbi:helix-turn-helix domain-containing protein [Salisaeta longa]|uniref:helix-turn-helix domain-containing protein n=1 Tax=Salisaeta longa TaxID=503170 RepID=UPI00048E9324|nr:AraC family transcriptional regulator [Salisaeta longa]
MTTSRPARQHPSLFRQRLEHAIQHHLDVPTFGVQELAHHLAMSRSTLYRRVQAYYDVSPCALIRARRMQAARALLRTEQSVTQIAFAVGYSSVQSFSTQFRDYHDRAPTEHAAACSSERVLVA